MAHRDRWRSLGLPKGISNNTNLQMFCWDPVALCEPSKCPIGDWCKYKDPPSHQRALSGKFKCLIQSQYMNYIYRSTFLREDRESKLTEERIHKYGLLIVPLYLQLIKLKIVELSLHNPMIVNDKGGTSVHPVYKEIRETIKSINGLMRDLGVYKPPQTPNIGRDVITYGDSDYYERMYDGSGTETEISTNESEYVPAARRFNR